MVGKDRERERERELEMERTYEREKRTTWDVRSMPSLFTFLSLDKTVHSLSRELRGILVRDSFATHEITSLAV